MPRRYVHLSLEDRRKIACTFERRPRCHANTTPKLLRDDVRKRRLS